MSKRVPIKVARELAKTLGMKKVIIILEEDRDDINMQHVITYGKSVEDCTIAAQMGNKIKRHLLLWPEDKCNDKPRRQILKEKRDACVSPTGKTN